MATRTPIRTPQQAFEAYVTGHDDLSKAYANRRDPNQKNGGNKSRPINITKNF